MTLYIYGDLVSRSMIVNVKQGSDMLTSKSNNFGLGGKKTQCIPFLKSPAKGLNQKYDPLGT